MESALKFPKSRSLEAAVKPPKERWRLDSSGFHALLDALDPDRDAAAERYAGLRERLSRFFTWNHADDPDAQADEVLDRVARRISSSGNDDESVRHPERFAAGVARMLLREGWRSQKAAVQMISSLQMESGSHHQLQEERRQTEQLSALLDECLSELPAEHRDLIRRYYSAESRLQIESRKKMADELDISLNTLRNRALRIRGEVERKARKRLETMPF